MQKTTSCSYLPMEREQLTADLIAGFMFAVVHVPQALGKAVPATVNPVYSWQLEVGGVGKLA